jgi:release factor glutamine methyltransferase
MVFDRVRRGVRLRAYHTLMRVYGPVTMRLGRRRRMSRWRGLRFTVPPGVFHPGFFLSSHALADEMVDTLDLRARTALDVGTGSGFLALVAARAGATTTAIDINPAAVETARNNASRNGLTVEVLQSDLFDALDERVFDVVVVNPPYFRKDPAEIGEHAWHAGAEFQYFDHLFAALPQHTHAGSTILMVLGEFCDLAAISAAAERQRCAMTERRRKTSKTLGQSVIYDITAER